LFESDLDRLPSSAARGIVPDQPDSFANPLSVTATNKVTAGDTAGNNTADTMSIDRR